MGLDLRIIEVLTQAQQVESGPASVPKPILQILELVFVHPVPFNKQLVEVVNTLLAQIISENLGII